MDDLEGGRGGSYHDCWISRLVTTELRKKGRDVLFSFRCSQAGGCNGGVLDESGQHLVADTAKLGPTPVVNLARNQGEQGEPKLPIAHRGEAMYLCT